MSQSDVQNSSQQAEQENTCVVCFKRTLIYSIGTCNHPVCFECSSRMRCLLLQNECPICRQDLPKVIFTKSIDSFSNLDRNTRSGLFEKKYRIVFSDLDIQKVFYNLLEFRCSKCDENKLFVDFHKLKEHVRKNHELFYCEICTENLKIFPSERRCYNRSQLAQHRRVGDSDDKSHKGHPRCDFCELRYLDKDELFRHLRREHFFCHICDADGINYFYGTMREMRDHFKAEHFLCEEDDCLEEEFTAVFRTEIDLRAHKATVHSKTMSRAEVRQARMLEIDFSYGPRGRGGGNENNRGGRIRTNDSQREFDREVNQEPQMIQHPPIDTKNEEHFPSLSGPSTAPAILLADPVRHVVYRRSGLARTNENFPALGGGGNEKINKIQGKQQNVSKSKSGPTTSSLFKATSSNNSKITSISAPSQQKPQPSASSSKKTFQKDSISDFPSLGPSSSKTSFFSEAPMPTKVVNKRLEAFNAPKSTVVKKDSPNGYPLGFTSSSTSKKRDLMEDLILPSNSIEKGIVSSKHRGLINDYVSVASQMTKMNLVKQKDESIGQENKNFVANSVPQLNSTNNFPSLGFNESSTKPSPQWITVSNSKTNNNNNNNIQKKNNNNTNNNQSTKQSKPEVPQKNQQKANGTKKVNSNNNDNRKTTNEKQITTKDSIESKENRLLLEQQQQQHMIPMKPPPGFKQIQQQITNSYSPVPDASKRNQALVEEFQKVLKTNDAMQEFRVLSQMFRDGNYFARSYYESCKGVLGEKFDGLFPELLVLLPDIEKQQKLYRIHLEESLIDVDITDENPATKKKNNKKSQKSLEVCATCQQVLLNKDFLQHVQSHSMENSFPTLSNEISSSAKTKSTLKK